MGGRASANGVLVAYLVECAHHVARQVAASFGDAEVHLIGFPGCDPNEYAQEVIEMIACGAHMVLFSTGRGSVVGSAIAPVVKVCANPETWRRMGEDMDVDAGRIVEGRATLEEVGAEILDRIVRVAAGEPTCPEALGHQEFRLTYKHFGPLGPSCLPG